MQISYHKRDSTLAKNCAAGNAMAQRELYDKYAGKMMAICMRYAPNRAEAEDILQEGFIRVFTKIGSYKEKGSLESWIRRVIINVAIRHYQKNNHLQTLKNIDENLKEFPSVTQEHQYDYEQLLSLVQQLPNGYRLVFNLYAIEGFSHKEIAKKLGISTGTSKSQLARARALLQLKLTGLYSKTKKKVSHEFTA